MIGYLDKDSRPLILIILKMSGYVKIFKVEDKINELILFHIDDEKLLEKYKAIWTKIEELKNIQLNALTVYDDRYIKTKKEHTTIKFILTLYRVISSRRWYRITIFSIDSLLAYESKSYLQVYLDSCTYKIKSKQITDFPNEDLFED